MSDPVTNLFTHRSAAQRYAAARPYFHPQVAARIVTFTSTPRFPRALDIACGTGQSARALADIADAVDATDISPGMLAQAQEQPHDQIHYQLAPAERLPFPDGTFDLATVGLAFHWFDQAAFLAEARRVLKPDGWLVLYNSGFTGEMLENPAFGDWARNTYPRRFPTPPRRSWGVSAESVQPHGFTLAGQESFTHDERMTPQQLTAYLSTQTNVIAAVESGTTPLEETTAWILAGITPFFPHTPATFRFAGTIWYLRSASERITNRGLHG